jgi:hypothetical protein
MSRSFVATTPSVKCARIDCAMESLPYRVAGTLLLLYAQPPMKIVALPTAAIVIAPLDSPATVPASTSN